MDVHYCVSAGDHRSVPTAMASWHDLVLIKTHTLRFEIQNAVDLLVSCFFTSLNFIHMRSFLLVWQKKKEFENVYQMLSSHI